MLKSYYLALEKRLSENIYVTPDSWASEGEIIRYLKTEMSGYSHCLVSEQLWKVKEYNHDLQIFYRNTTFPLIGYIKDFLLSSTATVFVLPSINMSHYMSIVIERKTTNTIWPITVYYVNSTSDSENPTAEDKEVFSEFTRIVERELFQLIQEICHGHSEHYSFSERDNLTVDEIKRLRLMESIEDESTRERLLNWENRSCLQQINSSDCGYIMAQNCLNIALKQPLKIPRCNPNYVEITAMEIGSVREAFIARLDEEQKKRYGRQQWISRLAKALTTNQEYCKPLCDFILRSVDGLEIDLLLIQELQVLINRLNVVGGVNEFLGVTLEEKALNYLLDPRGLIIKSDLSVQAIKLCCERLLEPCFLDQGDVIFQLHERFRQIKPKVINYSSESQPKEKAPPIVANIIGSVNQSGSNAIQKSTFNNPTTSVIAAINYGPNAKIKTKIIAHPTLYETKTPSELANIILTHYECQLRNQPLLGNALKYYVPHDASQIPLPHDKEKHRELRKPLNDAFIYPFLSDLKHPLLLLLGESGVGKSTYVHWLASNLWENYNKNPNSYIPIIIELKSIDKKEDAVNLGRFIEPFFQEVYGFHLEDINTLKEMKLLFIFDGYDEKKGADYNLYAINHLGFWNAKAIITSRTQHLHSNQNYQHDFQVKDHFMCYELYIAPFDTLQIDTFIKDFVTIELLSGNSTGDKINNDNNLTSETLWDFARYQESLKQHPQLYELVENPLLLRMVIRALPKIIADLDHQKIIANKHERVMYLPIFMRAQIYKAFISDWFNREAQRYQERTGKRLVTLWGSTDLLTQEAFGMFCEDLALSMLTENKDSEEILIEVEYTLPSSVTRRRRQFPDQINPWAKFFTMQDETVVNVRLGCPLRCISNKYSFYHKSFLEYFIALAMFNGLLDEESIMLSDDDIIQHLVTEPINQKLVTKEQAIIEFLSQMLKGDHRRIERMLSIIRASRETVQGDKVAIAAANAITVLNKAFFNFSGLDLHGINIARANLQGAYCDQTDFSGSNLTDVQLSHAWLRQIVLRNCQLNGLNFGEYPWFKHKYWVNSIDWNFDQNILITACGKNVYLWKFDTGVCFKVLQGHTGLINSISMSKNGLRIVSGSKDKTVRVWDVVSGECSGLGECEDIVNSVHINVYGRCIAFDSNDTKVQERNMLNEKAIVLRGHDDIVNSVHISIDGQCVISGSNDKTIRVWDVKSGKSTVLQGHEDVVNCVYLSVDGQCIVSGSNDKTVRVWDVKSGDSLVLRGHEDIVRCVHLSTDRKCVISGSEDTTIRVWDLLNNKSRILYGHEFGVTSVYMSDDGKQIASGSLDKKVRIWDIATGASLILHGHVDYVTSVNLCKDSQQLISGSQDGTVRVWDLSSGVDSIIHGHNCDVMGVHLSSNGQRIASGGFDKKVKVWDVSSGEAILLGDESTIWTVHLSGDGQYVASGSLRGAVRVWDVKSGVSTVLRGHEEDVRSVYLSVDGRWVASGGWDKTVRVWDVVSGKTTVLLGHKDIVESVYLGMNAKYVISGSRDCTVRVWDVASGEFTELCGHVGWVNSVYLSVDGQWVATGSSDKMVRVWNIETGIFIELSGHEAEVQSVHLSTDSQWAISGSFDRTVRIWEVTTRSQKAILHFSSIVVSISMHDASGLLAIASDRSIMLWQRMDDLWQTWQLKWTSTYPNPILTLSDCDVTGSVGLSLMNQRLLDQRRIVIAKDAKAFKETGLDYANRGWPDYAIRDFNRAILLDPNDADTLNYRGASKIKLGHYVEAYIDIEEAIRLGLNNSKVYFNRGECKRCLNYDLEAIVDYDKAILLDPNDALNFHKRAVCKVNLNRLSDAVNDLDIAIKLDPDYALAFKDRGKCKYILGQYQYSIQDYDETSQCAVWAKEIFQLRVLSELVLDLNEEAIADCNIAVECGLNNADIFFQRGKCKHFLMRYSDALIDYDRAIELNLKDQMVFFYRGMCKINLNHYNDAIADFDHVIRLYPNNVLGYKNRGICKYYLERFEEALIDLDETIQLDPKDMHAYEGRGNCNFALGRYQSTLDDYNKLLSMDPNNFEILRYRGVSKFYLGQEWEAIADYNEVIRIDSNNIHAYRNRGICYINLGQYDRAVNDFIKAFIHVDTDTEPHLVYLHSQYLAFTNFLQRSYQRTLNILISAEALIENISDKKDVFFILGNRISQLIKGLLNCATDKRVEGQAILHTLTDNFPNNTNNLQSDLRTLQGIGLSIIGFYQEALLCWEQVLDRDPEYQLAQQHQLTMLEILSWRESKLVAQIIIIKCLAINLWSRGQITTIGVLEYLTSLIVNSAFSNRLITSSEDNLSVFHVNRGFAGKYFLARGGFWKTVKKANTNGDTNETIETSQSSAEIRVSK